MQVYTGSGQRLGSVEPAAITLTPDFDIKDETGRSVLRLEGPLLRIGEVDFKASARDLFDFKQVYDISGATSGKINMRDEEEAISVVKVLLDDPSMA